MLQSKRILLVVAGGIAAYKTLELIRRLKDRGCAVRCILTAAGAEFVTPLSIAALSGEKVYRDLFSLTDEAEMGHIRLSREADLVVVAPATADLLARMAAGMADDLATTALLATDKPVLVAPAMNVMMWQHAATQANLRLLEARGVRRVGPNPGDLACGETGPGRMAEPHEILSAIESELAARSELAGRTAIVTSGPTFEAIDPVRFIGNRSSGKQGHALAKALADLGAKVTLVSGPTFVPDPPRCRVVRIESAREMLAAVEAALPADVFAAAAAVADWRAAETADAKIKKAAGSAPPRLDLVENPDILASVAKPGPCRPRLVIGFAAETEDVVDRAREKRRRKGCDWIVANNVAPGTGTFGGDANSVHIVDAGGSESWPELTKDEVARRIAERVVRFFAAELSRPEAAQ
jgi:phosphopantothenoylcysteine decarboxylase/phosphopantothenate--cysteine ligase